MAGPNSCGSAYSSTACTLEESTCATGAPPPRSKFPSRYSVSSHSSCSLAYLPGRRLAQRSAPALTLLGIAGGSTDTAYNWFCLDDIPTGAVPAGSGAFCYDTPGNCLQGALAARPARACKPAHRSTTAMDVPLVVPRESLLLLLLPPGASPLLPGTSPLARARRAGPNACGVAGVACTLDYRCEGPAPNASPSLPPANAAVSRLRKQPCSVSSPWRCRKCRARALLPGVRQHMRDGRGCGRGHAEQLLLRVGLPHRRSPHRLGPVLLLGLHQLHQRAQRLQLAEPVRDQLRDVRHGSGGRHHV